MAYTVAVSFDTFYNNINLGGDHRETANKRRDDIVQTLNKSFDVIEAFSAGSIPKFTALKAHADLDVIVVLHWKKHVEGKTPTQVLQAVRDVLAEYRTGARKNGQAVTLFYKTWPNVDIVPVARMVYSDNSFSHYNVPNSNNDTWIESRPKQHAEAIEAKASECGANFRKIIKMIKEWNRVHSDYLSSYHIECLALRVFSGNLDDTSWHVFKFFSDARKLLEGPMWYDRGFVDDYLSWSDRQQVLKRFDTAIATSQLAWYNTWGDNKDHKTAISQWRQVFSSQFPAYG